MQVLGEACTKDALELWKAIHKQYCIDPQIAKNMVLVQLKSYMLMKDREMSIVGDKLAVMLSQYVSITGNSLKEDLKTDYLLNAARVIADGQLEMTHTVQSIACEHTKSTQPFEQARKELILQDKAKPRSSKATTVQQHNQAQALHMFQVYASVHQGGKGQSQWDNRGFNTFQMQGQQQQYGPLQPTIQPPWAQRPQYQQRRAPQRSVRCWHCGKEGHLTRDCEAKQTGWPAETEYNEQGNLQTSDGTIIQHFYEDQQPTTRRNQMPMMLNNKGYQYQQGGNKARGGEMGRAGPALPPQESILRIMNHGEAVYKAGDDSV